MPFKELFSLQLLKITQYDIKIKISQYASVLSFSNYSSWGKQCTAIIVFIYTWRHVNILGDLGEPYVGK
jgi:hypothetical protein